MPAAGQYIGGIAVLLSQLLQSWNLPWQVEFFNTEGTKRDYGRTGRLSLANLGRFVRNSLGLLAAVQRHRPVLVHYHTSQQLALLKDLVTVTLLKCFGRCKVVGHIHWAAYPTLLVGPEPVRALQVRWLLRIFDGLILMSENIRNDLHQALPTARQPVLQQKAHVVYNFTSLPTLPPPAPRETHPVTWFFIGDIGRRKGVLDILSAARQLQQEGITGFQIVLAGPFSSATAEEEIQSRIREYGLESRVRFTGSVGGEVKDRLFREADLFVLPSYGEGLPMSLLEAMAYSLPAVTTRVGGIPEAVEDGQEGFLMEPGDVESLSRALKQLMDSSELRARMGRKGRARVEARHTPDHYLQTLERVYRKILN